MEDLAAELCQPILWVYGQNDRHRRCLNSFDCRKPINFTQHDRMVNRAIFASAFAGSKHNII